MFGKLITHISKLERSINILSRTDVPASIVKDLEFILADLKKELSDYVESHEELQQPDQWTNPLCKWVEGLERDILSGNIDRNSRIAEERQEKADETRDSLREDGINDFKEEK